MIIGKVGKISMNIWAKLIWDKSRIIHVKCLVAKSHCYHECRIKIKKNSERNGVGMRSRKGEIKQN